MSVCHPCGPDLTTLSLSFRSYLNAGRVFVSMYGCLGIILLKYNTHIFCVVPIHISWCLDLSSVPVFNKFPCALGEVFIRFSELINFSCLYNYVRVRLDLKLEGISNFYSFFFFTFGFRLRFVLISFHG